MRVLLTPLPTMAPLARAFRDKGHEAVIATGPAMAHVENTVVMPDIPAPSDFGPPPPWVPERDGPLEVPLWAGELVDIAPFAPLEIPHLEERKDEVRARFGTAATEPCFTAGSASPSWHPAQHHHRAQISRGSWEKVPEIVATSGTNADLLMTGSRLPHLVVEVLGEVAARSVVAIGRGDWTGPRPSNVRARSGSAATTAAHRRQGVRDARGLPRRAGVADRGRADGGRAAVSPTSLATALEFKI